MEKDAAEDADNRSDDDIKPVIIKNILLKNYHNGVKYCAKELNKSYYSIKSMYQKKNNMLI
jgi:hypothetical protein